VAPAAQQLYDLQHIDVEIARLTQQADQLTAAIGDQFKVKAGDLAIKQAEDALRKAQAAQRDREYELSALESRIKEHEQRLYSGKGSPRDLQALQADIEKDRARGVGAEVQALKSMYQTEKGRAVVERVRAAVARVLSEVSAGKEKQGAERDTVQQQLARRHAQREAIASGVSAGAMQLYERLRQRVPDGLPVARVVQQRCEGCKDNLPSAEIQRARHAEAPVQCASCQRILLVS
jgi:predicted  nucleic acid-binding Zn-ribbon protein